ncbi:MAG: LysR family transcriptional regulator [Chitinivibrionales bacterium]|nr:LysR family transcriptional regulator [Chitinivibrionales bacterium]
MPPSPPKPFAKLYLSSEMLEGVFGDGKWELLKSIAEEGSIQRAAERLGRGYRKAWDDIKRAEKGLGKSLVSKRRGGANGGETVLTPFGTRLLKSWERYRHDIDKAVHRAYRKHLVSAITTKENVTR